MSGGRRKPRLAYVVTFALPSAALALGCCPEKIKEGDTCYFFQVNCSEHNDDCGSNGFSCVKGKWKEDFTYCNPPSFPPSGPRVSHSSPSVSASSSGHAAPPGSSGQKAPKNSAGDPLEY